MKYTLVILLCLMILPGLSQAGIFPDGTKDQQQPTNKPNKPAKEARVVNRIARVKMAKEAFLTAQLELTPAQKEKFLPVWNKYQDEFLKALNEKRLNNSADQANGTEQLLKETAIEQKILDIRIYYRNEFLKILPPEKVSMIYKSEKQFNDELVKKLKEGRQDAANN